MECPYCQSRISQYSKRCHICGQNIPAGQRFLEDSGVVESGLAADPAAPAATSARNSGRYRFARLGDRFIAFVLDTALLFGLFAMVDAWIFTRWGRVDGSELQLTTASLVIALTLNATILFLYGWLLEAACGATLGKAMLGIRVVTTGQGGALSACAVRNVVRIIDGLAFYAVGTVVAASSGIRQRIGDICARTVVIEESFGRGIKATTIVLWITLLVGAAWAVPRICAANHPVQTKYLSHVIIRIGMNRNHAYFRAAELAVDVHTPLLP